MDISFRQLADFFDSERPPVRFRGHASGDDLSWYSTRPLSVRSRVHAAIRNHASVPPGLINHSDKGLVQLYRWQPRQRDELSRSFRQMGERHFRGDTTISTLLVYNTWLIKPPLNIAGPLDRRQRIPEIGRALDASGIDIVALAEVFKASDGKAIENELSFAFESRRGPGPKGLEISSGLHLIVRKSTGRIAGANKMVFENSGGLPDNLAQKGVLHTEIDLGPGRIDLFLTHLHAEEAETRRLQIKELLAFIKQHKKPRNVTIVVGDLNVDGRTLEYASLVKAMAARGLHDVWISHGSRLGATAAVNDFEAICALDETRIYCRDIERSSDPVPTTLSDRIPGYRLDYIFIETPKDSHTVNVDLSRIRRRPFWRGAPGTRKKFTRHVGGKEIPNYLSDHLALELSLRLSNDTEN